MKHTNLGVVAQQTKRHKYCKRLLLLPVCCTYYRVVLCSAALLDLTCYHCCWEWIGSPNGPVWSRRRLNVSETAQHVWRAGVSPVGWTTLPWPLRIVSGRRIDRWRTAAASRTSCRRHSEICTRCRTGKTKTVGGYAVHDDTRAHEARLRRPSGRLKPNRHCKAATLRPNITFSAAGNCWGRDGRTASHAKWLP